MKSNIEISKKWNALETDGDRWNYLIESQDKLLVMLDNDQTHVLYANDDDNSPELKSFYSSIGNSTGVYDLLEVLGVEAISA